MCQFFINNDSIESQLYISGLVELSKLNTLAGVTIECLAVRPKVKYKVLILIYIIYIYDI